MLLALPPERLKKLVLAMIERQAFEGAEMMRFARRDGYFVWDEQARDWIQWPQQLVAAAVDQLMRRSIPFTADETVRLLRHMTGRASRWGVPYHGITSTCERLNAAGEFTPEVRAALADLRASIEDRWQGADWARKLRERMDALLGKRRELDIAPGEAWSDAALLDLTRLRDAELASWSELLMHCSTADGGKPSGKWLKEATKLLDAVTTAAFSDKAARWFPLVDKPRTQPYVGEHGWQPAYFHDRILDPHARLLKGLAWCCAICDQREAARALTQLAISSYRKLPGTGPRMISLGNACVWALGEMPGRDGVGELAVLKVRVKFGTAQKLIEKALNTTAERLGVPRDEVEEMGVPSYGLDDVGVRREQLGDYTAELRVEGDGSTELRFFKGEGGKPQKSVPAALKAEHAEDLKELKGAAKDIERMLPAQRDRIDGLFLRQKSWPMATWRERYLDHPLVGVLARRLIWRISGLLSLREGQGEGASGEARLKESEPVAGSTTRVVGGSPTQPPPEGEGLEGGVASMWLDGRLVNVRDEPIEFADDARVELWHPIGRPVDEVLAWRSWLERHEVKQPFKQAHREVYVLTDAERNTRVYSNRYAAHLLKQHQFNALCAARGWKNKLRLMVDDTYPPAHRELANWGLRAEFWIEGAGDDYQRDVNESGTYLYVTTDQVRFYPTAAAQLHAHAGGGGYEWSRYRGEAEPQPIPLEEIPPLVFSEIMRDVDLFVGVASVGNDANWIDERTRPDRRTYWQSYSFGELSGTAQTRKAVLERVVPRLKIAGRCSFDEKFLRVRGDLRTYKIHLGSGNILMEPNDQYLCIVPKSSAVDGASGKVFLPFEGDRVLSIILSKAFLLAEDAKIADETITRQIAR